MSGPPRVETDRGVPFEWWYVVAIGTSAWLLFLATLDLEGTAGQPLVDSLALLALLAWPSIPVAMYLDLRALGDGLAWVPATTSWLAVSLVPFANAAAGLAYCLRRRVAVRGDLPSASWRYAVHAGLLAWLGVVAADVAVDRVDIGLVEPLVFGPLIAVAWFGFPVAVYLDAERARFATGMSPNVRALVAMSAVPLLNILVGAIYIVGRWWHRQQADPDAEPAVPGSAAERDARPASISPWYRRALGVFVGYFLLVVVLGSWLPLETEFAWEALSLLVWPPFGLAFVACFHLDNRAVREAGVAWGWTRYLYYSTVVFPGPAFWYLLSRLTKVNRARSKGLLDDDGAASTTPPGAVPGSADDGGRADRGEPGFDWAGDAQR